MSHPKPRRPEPKSALPIVPLLLVGAGALLVGIVAWVQLGGAGSRSAPEVTGAPRLKADRQAVDLGTVKLGSPVEVAFTLTNVGDQPLRLSEAPYVELVDGC